MKENDIDYLSKIDDRLENIEKKIDFMYDMLSKAITVSHKSNVEMQSKTNDYMENITKIMQKTEHCEKEHIQNCDKAIIIATENNISIKDTMVKNSQMLKDLIDISDTNNDVKNNDNTIDEIGLMCCEMKMKIEKKLPNITRK